MECLGIGDNSEPGKYPEHKKELERVIVPLYFTCDKVSINENSGFCSLVMTVNLQILRWPEDNMVPEISNENCSCHPLPLMPKGERDSDGSMLLGGA